MALTNCKKCGKEISDQASKCPHCGASRLDAIGVPNSTARKVAGWLLILFGIGVLVFQCASLPELRYDPTGKHSLLLKPGDNVMGWGVLMIGGGIYLLRRKGSEQ